MNLEQMIESLSKKLDFPRFQHSLNVMDTAEKMGEHYGLDPSRAKIAGLLHDCGKNYKGKEARSYIRKIGYKADEIENQQTRLLHGIIGAHIAQHEYGIQDDEILSAIRWHTTGKAGMTLLEKIIYVADYIEPGRSFRGIDEMRQEAFKSLDKCIVLCADSTIRYVVDKGFLLHPKTVETRNDSIMLLSQT